MQVHSCRGMLRAHMRRIHLIELEDHAWFPAAVRDAATDSLQYGIEHLKPYRVIVPHLRSALKRSRSRQVLDLCSGGGGPWLGLLPQLGDDSLRITLSDRFPNLPALERLHRSSNGRLAFVREAVDATRVPQRLPGFRTLFTAFHHFEPETAGQIVADAVRAGEGIAVFELTERRLVTMLGVLLVPVAILLTTPLIRPLRWSRLIWTYLVPAVPFVGLWDGLISCLRSYTCEELRLMAEAAGGEFEWSIGAEPVPGTPARVTYLIGTPRQTGQR